MKNNIHICINKVRSFKFKGKDYNVEQHGMIKGITDKYGCLIDWHEMAKEYKEKFNEELKKGV